MMQKNRIVSAVAASICPDSVSPCRNASAARMAPMTIRSNVIKPKLERVLREESKLNVSELVDNAEKQEKYIKCLSDYRREKVLKQKNPNGRALSLGAGFLLSVALNKRGIIEKNTKYGFSDNGKPYLLDNPGISFNLSHSHERVMCVVADSQFDLGCDVELVRNGKEKIAERFFTIDESNAISSESDEKRRAEMFFELWTLKESFLKCTGEGIGRPMNSFEFIRIENECDEYLTEGSYHLKTFTGNHPIYYGYKYALCYNLRDDGMNSDKCNDQIKNDDIEKCIYPIFM